MKRAAKPVKTGLLILLFTLMLLPLKNFAEPVSPPEETGRPAGTITLRQAVAAALIHNPELESFSWEKRSREARTLQLGLLPNPELAVEAEDAAGSGGFRGFDRSQTTLRLGQLIELGGKRAARVRAGSLSQELAHWDYETKRMDVLTRVAKAFTDVLKAQNGISLAEELSGLAERTLKAVAERAGSGKVPPIEETKAQVALANTHIELERARRELDTARGTLSATWGETAPRFQSATGLLDLVAEVPPFEALARRLANNPDLARWAAELKQRQAVVDMELAKAVPDIKVQGGYRRLEESGDNAVVFGFSVPLQFFDRNQGATEAARHRLVKAEAEKRAAEIHAARVLAETYNALRSAYSEAMSLKTKVLPGAQGAFDAVNEGYRFGKFGLLDVLDSQRTLFEARGKYVQALANYHKAAADVERLTGEPLAAIGPEPQNSGGEPRP
ncbi:MAG: TolC family protein [Nitrospinae bacterium]|nr:TolC family protein [Nitrospinota bacterium]